jgi:hypothetical protein
MWEETTMCEVDMEWEETSIGKYHCIKEMHMASTYFIYSTKTGKKPYIDLLNHTPFQQN